MISGEIGVRYSKALFHLASDQKELERDQRELEGILSLFGNTPRLKQFLSAPQVDKLEKKKVLATALGGKIDQKLLFFLFFLLDKGRLPYLEEIARNYQRLVRERLGVLEASLVTAVPVEGGYKDTLAAKIEKAYKKKVEMNEKVDTSLIGGGILILDNQVLDFSLKTRLGRLKERLLALKT